MENLNTLDQLRPHFPQLTAVFAQHWRTPLRQYAARLYQRPPRFLEPALLDAFAAEWSAAGYDEALIQKGLTQLQRTPVLQTAHHLTPTHGPTFLTIDLISLAGLAADQVYLVAANSGVAFSNSAWSGALSYGDLALESLVQPESPAFKPLATAAAERKAHGENQARISLIPSRQRDGLVFGYRLEAETRQLIGHFTPRLQQILPPALEAQSYCHWAARCAAGIQQRLFDDHPLLIFDLNRVICHYLVRVLSDFPNHPCSLLLSDHPLSERILGGFGHPPLFLGAHRGKKSTKVNPLHWTGKGFQSDKTGFENCSQQNVLAQLGQDRLCPGIFLVFMVLRFLNGIRCLGSFNQIEYLTHYRQTWETLRLDWPLDLEKEEDPPLTTGRYAPEGRALWPLDLVMSDRRLPTQGLADREMGFFWGPILAQLTSSSNRG